MDVRAEVVDILAGFALFADLTTPELESLVDTFDEQMFSEGERVVRQGLAGPGLYVLATSRWCRRRGPRAYCFAAPTIRPSFPTGFAAWTW